ncbi:MAG: ABC transporter ATP-binding protein [Anaerolineaceae bacterium]|nr:ABC transporter ATP-binding protein [Anaerolineaceae bacterium]
MPADTHLVVLQVSRLRKLYPLSRGLLGAIQRKPARHVHAIDGISFTLRAGEILGLVGESGSGKTTTAMSVMGLIEPTEGDIHFNGQSVPQMVRGRDRLELRRKVQMVFQDPYEALNPRQTVYSIVSEPLEVHRITASRTEKLERVKKALADAGLKPPENFLDRYPEELSGGQRQRVVIAGAIVLNPRLLVADEPVSMLDVSVRAEILNLLRQVRDELGISILYITHDLATAGFFTDRIAVMYLGRIVEIGPTTAVLSDPKHPYTRALLSVIPVPNPRRRQKREILQGEIPNPIDLPSGCRFHPRCPVAVDQCRRVDPQLVTVTAEHQAACILVEERVGASAVNS